MLSWTVTRDRYSYDPAEISKRSDADTFRALIALDVKRTGGNVMTPEQSAALERILLSYAQRNMNVGYCQGLNMIAHFFHVEMGFDEAESFWLMTYLIEEAIGEEFYQNTTYIVLEIKLFSLLLATHNERMDATIRGLEFDFNLSMIPWLVTCFTFIRNLELKIAIIDMIMAQGMVAFYKIGLVFYDYFGQFRNCGSNGELLARQAEWILTFKNVEEFKRKFNELFIDPEVLLFIRRKFYERESDRLMRKVRARTACRKTNLFCQTVRDARFVVRFGQPKVFQTFPLLAQLKPVHFSSSADAERHRAKFRSKKSKSSPLLSQASGATTLDRLTYQKQRDMNKNNLNLTRLAPHVCPEFSGYQQMIDEFQEKLKKKFLKQYSKRAPSASMEKRRISLFLDPPQTPSRPGETNSALKAPAEHKTRASIAVFNFESTKKYSEAEQRSEHDDFFEGDLFEPSTKELERINDIMAKINN